MNLRDISPTRVYLLREAELSDGRVKVGMGGRAGTGNPLHQTYIAFLIINVTELHRLSWLKHLEDQKLNPPFHEVQSEMIIKETCNVLSRECGQIMRI